MSYIFELPVILSFFIILIGGGVLYLIGYAALHILSNHARHDILSIPIGTFIGTIATAWALSLGFVAADIWLVNSKADQALIAEKSSITRLLGSASLDVLNSPALEGLVLDYRRLVIEDEWVDNKNMKPSYTVDMVLQKIRTEIFILSKTDIPAPMISKIINDFDELQDARNIRLSIGITSVDINKWYLLIALTILTIITIASVHADRRRAGIKAIIIYVITSIFCLWILAIHANPYQGADPLKGSLLLSHHVNK